MTTEVANLIARLRADASGYVAGIGQAVSANTQLVSSHRQTAQQISQVGGTLTKYVTLPIVAVGVASTKMSIDFNSSIAKMHGLAGVASADLGKLRSDVLSLAGETAQKPQDLAKAMYFITSGGIDAAHATDVLRASAKAATAGLGNVQDVAYATVSAINAYSKSGLTASQATDVMVATVKDATFEADQLAQTMGRVLPIAAVMGVGFDQVGAALAVMSQGGLDAFHSTTALLGILTQIQKPTTEAQDLWRKMFGSMDGVRKVLKEDGLNGLLQQMAAHLHGNADAISKLFPDVRGLVGALSFMAQNQGKVNGVFKDTANATGSTDKAFKTMMDTLQGKLGAALAKISVALIKFGDAGAPFIAALASAFGGLADVLSHVPEPLLVIAGALGAMLAAAGPVLVVAGALARGWLSLTELAAASAAKHAANAAALAANAEAETVATAAAGAHAAALAAETDQLALFDVALIGSTEQLALFDAAEFTATVASESLLATLGPIGIALAAVGIVALVVTQGFHNATSAADQMRHETDDLYNSLKRYNDLKPDDKSKLFNDAAKAAADLAARLRERASHPAGINPNDPNDPSLAPHVDLSKPAIDVGATHAAFQKLIDDAGALQAKRPFADLMSRLGAIPGGLNAVGNAFADIKRQIDAADHAAVHAAVTFGAKIGVSAADATAAMRAYDASLDATKTYSDATRAAGERAAVSLQAIGVAAGFAGQATVDGMSQAAIAVAGLVASIQAGLDAVAATDSLLGSFQAVQDANTNVGGGGGGGGGGGQTASAAAIEQRSKELALRDAQREVANTTLQVAQAQLGLAQAHETAREAAISLSDAEKEYERVLHGVAAGSREAIDAQLAYAQAKNDAASAGLDVSAARRNLEQVKNDKKLLDFAVQDARRKLAEDMGKGGEQHWVVTPTGSKLEPTQPGADPNQIAKDRIALKDALIAQSGAADATKRAELELSNAEIAGKKAAEAARDAHKLLNELLHGHAKGSKEARDAFTTLVTAWLSSIGAAQGVTGAEHDLLNAQDQVQTSALNLWRAQEDLAGRLTTTGGAAQTAATHIRNVATATHQAEQNMFAWAQKIADASGAAKGSIGWNRVMFDSLTSLKNLLHPGGELGRFLDDLIAKFDALGKPRVSTFTITQIEGSSIGGGSGYRAAGGPVTAGQEYIVNEHGRRTERFVPNVAGSILPVAQMPKDMPRDDTKERRAAERFAPTVAASAAAPQQQVRAALEVVPFVPPALPIPPTSPVSYVPPVLSAPLAPYVPPAPPVLPSPVPRVPPLPVAPPAPIAAPVPSVLPAVPVRRVPPPAPPRPQNVERYVPPAVAPKVSERFVPNAASSIVPTAQTWAASGGAGTSTTIIKQDVHLVVQHLDPATAGPAVVAALREETRKNTYISGVRTE